MENGQYVKGCRKYVNHTYGYITKFNRIALGLDKSHNTDAFVIAGGTMQERSSISHLIQQVRKCNRKLFKGDRSHIKNTAADSFTDSKDSIKFYGIILNVSYSEEEKQVILN